MMGRRIVANSEGCFLVGAPTLGKEKWAMDEMQSTKVSE